MVLTGRQDNLKLRQNSSYKNDTSSSSSKNNSTLMLKEGRLDYKREEIRFQGKLKLAESRPLRIFQNYNILKKFSESQ
jgi:hypothetical protein